MPNVLNNKTFEFVNVKASTPRYVDQRAPSCCLEDRAREHLGIRVSAWQYPWFKGVKLEEARYGFHSYVGRMGLLWLASENSRCCKQRNWESIRIVTVRIAHFLYHL